jgi:hypothetical protein
MLSLQETILSSVSPDLHLDTILGTIDKPEAMSSLGIQLHMRKARACQKHRLYGHVSNARTTASDALAANPARGVLIAKAPVGILQHGKRPHGIKIVVFQHCLSRTSQILDLL